MAECQLVRPERWWTLAPPEESSLWIWNNSSVRSVPLSLVHSGYLWRKSKTAQLPLRGFRDRFDSSQQKNVTRNTNQKKNCRCGERSKKRMGCFDHIARGNRRSNARQLVAEIHDSAERSDAFSGRNQRRNGPSYRRGGG